MVKNRNLRVFRYFMRFVEGRAYVTLRLECLCLEKLLHKRNWRVLHAESC